MRDLGSADLWQESLERSRARRQAGSEPERPHDAPSAPPHPHPRTRGRLQPYSRTRARRRRAHLSLGGVCLVGTLLVLVVGVSLAGGRRARTPGLRRADASHRLLIGAHPGYARSSTSRTGTCQPTASADGYVNPLTRAVLVGERIDMGVDYAGRGHLAALGAGRITYVGSSGTGWPGAFIEYRLLSGPDAGCSVYYAEGVQPVPGLRRGTIVRAGQVIASIIPYWSTGIEIGWGAGHSTKTYAQLRGTWTPNEDARDVATSAGRSFSALIANLGGPPGKVEH